MQGRKVSSAAKRDGNSRCSGRLPIATFTHSTTAAGQISATFSDGNYIQFANDIVDAVIYYLLNKPKASPSLVLEDEPHLLHVTEELFRVGMLLQVTVVRIGHPICFVGHGVFHFCSSEHQEALEVMAAQNAARYDETSLILFLFPFFPPLIALIVDRTIRYETNDLDKYSNFESEKDEIYSTCVEYYNEKSFPLYGMYRCLRIYGLEISFVSTIAPQGNRKLSYLHGDCFIMNTESEGGRTARKKACLHGHFSAVAAPENASSGRLWTPNQTRWQRTPTSQIYSDGLSNMSSTGEAE
ncbi:hypothetical protein C0J52_23819 [Blattella germanica]|nr:hypothetical protein C0J52_23819 [Blattella germanica]